MHIRSFKHCDSRSEPVISTLFSHMKGALIEVRLNLIQTKYKQKKKLQLLGNNIFLEKMSEFAL